MAEPIATPTPDALPAPPIDSTAVARRRANAVFEVILCSSVPTQVAIGLLLRVAGWPVIDRSGQLSFNYVLAISIGDMVLLIMLMIVLMRAHGESPAALWVGSRPVRREALIGLLLIPVVFFAVVILLNLLRLIAPGLHNVAQNPLEQLARTPRNAMIFGAVAIFAGGVREELQRAFLLDRFEKHLGGPIVGFFIISIGFGLGHIVQGWDAVITTGVLGAFWAVIYLRRRSSVAPMVSHAGFNALEIVRAAAMS